MTKSLLNESILDERETFHKLRSIHQEHLVSQWKELTHTERKQIQKEITLLDIELFHQLRELPVQKHSFPLQPYQTPARLGNQEDSERGQALIRRGKCALVVLAGGMGSRLRFKGPKGCCPLSLVKKKSLFQLLAEKVKAASYQQGHPLQVAIMTSANHRDQTEAFFVNHSLFGLDPSQLTFFCQKSWPHLDFEGNLFWESPTHIACGPNGNGDLYRALFAEGVGEKWGKMGIEKVQVLPIDNPLATPFDAEFFGFHDQGGFEVAIKTAFCENSQEQVGILALLNGKMTVIEYTELSQELRRKGPPLLANLGIYCLSLPFIKKMKEVSMPLHKTKKAAWRMDEQKKTYLPLTPNAWKFEEFIFDAFSFAQSCGVLLCSRQLSFAPLKNLKGTSSIAAVQAAILALERSVYFNVTGICPPKEKHFELAPEFYYPTKEFFKKWKGKRLPETDYIEP